MKGIIMCVGLVAASLIAQPGLAQEVASDGNHSLQEILGLALEHHIEIRKADLSILEGQQKVREVKSQALPQLNGNANLTDNLLLPVLILPGEFTGNPGTVSQVRIGTQYNFAASASASQQIFNQSVFTGLQAAKASEEFYELSKALTEEQVIEQVASLYYQVLITQHQLEQMESTLQKLEENVRLVALQVDAGFVKKTDLSRLKVSQTNLKTQAQGISDGLSQQKNLLKYYTGIPLEQDVNLEGLNPAEMPGQVQLADDSEVTNLTSYRLLDAQQHLYSLEEKSFKSGYFPTLALTAQYAYNGVGNNFDYFKSKENSTLNWYDNASIGLQLSIPIFDGFRKDAQIQQSKIHLLKVQEDKRSTEKMLNLQRANALNTIRTSRESLLAQQENVALAQEVYNEGQRTYSEGVTSLSDLLDAETALTDAQLGYASALLQYRLSELQLLKSEGNIKSLVNQ
ncbi:MAG: TolC family protein [Imperialibacter sp.]